MYRVTPKRNGFVVLRTADRKQTHKGAFAKKKEAIDYMNSLYTNKAKADPSTLTFVNAYEAFVKEREEISVNPDVLLTVNGTAGYRSDFNKRIKPFMDKDVLLSSFDYEDMTTFLLKCHSAGHNYKTLTRTVRNIKTFLNEMKQKGKNPCLDMLHFRIDKFHQIVPTDRSERLEKDVAIIDDATILNIMIELNKTKDVDYQSAISFALFSISLFFGLRKSEIKGLKRKDVILDHNLLSINKIFIAREGGLLHRTKNVGSFRDIKLGHKDKLFLTWWLGWLEENYPENDWLFPAQKRSAAGPISDKGYYNAYWRTYERLGLAKLEWHNGHCEVISSPFKSAPSKTFRHRLATILIDALDKVEGVNRNYVKSRVGHTRFTTTQDRYGNHNRSVLDKTAIATSDLLSSKLQIKY